MFCNRAGKMLTLNMVSCKIKKYQVSVIEDAEHLKGHAYRSPLLKGLKHSNSQNLIFLSKSTFKFVDKLHCKFVTDCIFKIISKLKFAFN